MNKFSGRWNPLAREKGGEPIPRSRIVGSVNLDGDSESKLDWAARLQRGEEVDGNKQVLAEMIYAHKAKGDQGESIYSIFTNRMEERREKLRERRAEIEKRLSQLKEVRSFVSTNQLESIYDCKVSEVQIEFKPDAGRYSYMRIAGDVGISYHPPKPKDRQWIVGFLKLGCAAILGCSLASMLFGLEVSVESLGSFTREVVLLLSICILIACAVITLSGMFADLLGGLFGEFVASLRCQFGKIGQTVLAVVLLLAAWQLAKMFDSQVQMEALGLFKSMQSANVEALLSQSKTASTTLPQLDTLQRAAFILVLPPSLFSLMSAFVRGYRKGTLEHLTHLREERIEAATKEDAFQELAPLALGEHQNEVQIATLAKQIQQIEDELLVEMTEAQRLQLEELTWEQHSLSQAIINAAGAPKYDYNRIIHVYGKGYNPFWRRLFRR